MRKYGMFLIVIIISYIIYYFLTWVRPEPRDIFLLLTINALAISLFFNI